MSDDWIYDPQVGYDVSALATRLNWILAQDFGDGAPSVNYFKRQLRTWGQLNLLRRAGVTGATDNAATLYAEVSIYQALMFTHLTDLYAPRSVLHVFNQALLDPFGGHRAAIIAAANGVDVVLAAKSYAWINAKDARPYAPDDVPAGIATIQVALRNVVSAVDQARDTLGPIPKSPGLKPANGVFWPTD